MPSWGGLGVEGSRLAGPRQDVLATVRLSATAVEGFSLRLRSYLQFLRCVLEVPDWTTLRGHISP